MKSSLSVFACFFSFLSMAQNVGIGTSTPQSRLHLAGGGIYFNALTIENVSAMGGDLGLLTQINFRVGGIESAAINVFEKPANETEFNLKLRGKTQLYVNSAGNMGIGTITPTHTLEVNGKVRITDNAGIGVTSPTARFDLLGTFRYRGSGFPNLPQTGALLTSIDEEGNAQWQRPVVFKTRGLPALQTIPKNAWTKIIFKNNDMEVNQGLYFDPFTSTFNAPVKGAYHFDANVNMTVKSARSIMRIVVYRNGGYVKELQAGQNVCGVCGEEDEEFYRQLRGIKRRYYSTSGIFYLEPNDKVWLEVQQYDDEGYMIVDPSSAATWFSGSLLYRVQ